MSKFALNEDAEDGALAEARALPMQPSSRKTSRKPTPRQETPPEQEPAFEDPAQEDEGDLLADPGLLTGRPRCLHAKLHGLQSMHAKIESPSRPRLPTQPKRS